MATRGLLTETATATAGVLAADEIKKAVKEFLSSDTGKKITEKVGKRIGEMFDPDNNRVDMINFVFGPLLTRSNGIPTRNIALYLRNAMKDPMGDNSVVQVLCLVFKNTRAKNPVYAEKYLYPDPKDDQYLLDVFEELGLLSEEEFRERLEHWDHDRAGQLFKYATRQIKKGVATAASWARAFMVLTAVWFYLILRASVSDASQVDMWILALAPIPMIFLLGMFKKVTLIVFPLAHWVSERYRIGLTRFIGRVLATGFIMAFLLSIWPMPSGNMALLLAVGITGMLFAKLAKMFTVSIVSLLIIGYVAYGTFKAQDISNPQTIKATAESFISGVFDMVGLGPGTFQFYPYVLSFYTEEDKRIDMGESLWIEAKAGEWTETLSWPIGAEFVLSDYSRPIKVEWLRNNTVLRQVTDGPRLQVSGTGQETAVRFQASETTRFKATAHPKRVRR